MIAPAEVSGVDRIPPNNLAWECAHDDESADVI